MNDESPKSVGGNTEQAAAIASLWAKLTESAETDTEAQIFLLMFGPWASNRIRNAMRS